MNRENFLKIFEDIKDPRIARTKLHPLESIMGLGLLGALAGIDSFLGLQDFAEAHEEQLKAIIPFPNGIPSHDTIGRVFSRIDVDQFHECFFHFTQSLRDNVKGLIALDGKTMRNSKEDKPLHIVSAWCEANKLVLGQTKVNDKSNEITAIPNLLDMIDIEDHVVSIDAMGCQKNIAQKIVEKNGDYLLALKANQKNLLENVQAYFQDEETLNEMSYWKEFDKGHGRIEKRECWATSNISWIDENHDWPELITIAMVKCERTRKNKKSSDTRFYISSLPEDAEVICKTSRMHWGIENKLHWVLDVVFNEDKCMIRKDNAPEIMGIMRKWAINMHNQVKSEKMSLKRSLAKCAMSMKYLFTVLEAI